MKDISFQTNYRYQVIKVEKNDECYQRDECDKVVRVIKMMKEIKVNKVIST